MSVRASALVRRHPLVLFLVLAALLTGLYLHHGQHAVSSRSAFELSSSMAHFSFSDHFARLQNGHWHASSGYGQDSAKETSSNTRRILLQPEDAFKEQDGLVYLADIARPGANPSNKVEHPILYLIRQAKKDWQKKVDSQSKDLATAVKTYKLKYGRAPPKGFDRWFKFAKDSNVILVDNYDQIYRDMLPLLGLPSEPLQARSREMIDNPQNYHYGGSFTLWIKNGKISNITGGMADHTRVKEQTGLLERFVNLLPDTNITIWAHDTSVVHLSGEKRAELEDLAKQGKTLSRDRWDDWGDPPEYVGWEAFCKTGSNLRNAVGGLAPAQLVPSPSFISKHYEASDFCAHPLNVPLHSLTGNYGVGPRAVNLLPLFSHSKMTLYADILVTPLEQYEALVGLDPDWENKTQNKILWRGSTTGSRYDRGIVWRSTQRVRLALLTNSQDTNLNKTVYTTSIEDPNTLSTYEAPLPNLNEQFFDILFTGEPLQCANHDGTCESMKRHLPFAKKGMRQEEANTFKYIFDVDGNGWSGRFHRLMSSKAAVLKSQGFVEWWGDRVQPWVHYIPVKLDYSDLHSIASFFIGDQHSSGHDDLAREIGLAGKEWAEKHWRMEDMEAYMFRLYLEYARVMNRDPDDPMSWDYKEISK